MPTVGTPKSWLLIFLGVFLSACQSTTMVDLRSLQPTASIPATPSPVSALSIKPPPALLEAQGATQTAGIATYCWEEGNTGLCADATGMATPHEPLMITSPLTVTLRLPLEDAPSGVLWDVQPVTDADAMFPARQDYRWWNVYGTDATQHLALQREQAVPVEIEPGLHVVRVFVAWEGIGDVTYGFLLEAQ